jgi:hypothetical protein
MKRPFMTKSYGGVIHTGDVAPVGFGSKNPRRKQVLGLSNVNIAGHHYTH